MAQRELAKRELARRSLIEFTKRFWPDYTAGWVHYDIARRLEQFSRDVAARKSPRLMLLVPPRHGKSVLASQSFAAWHLGHHPSHEIVNAGYNLDLPMKFSRKVREIARSTEYQALFPTRLDPETQSIEFWMTANGGSYSAVGVGGGLTGRGAHCLIIDDPIKNVEEADSVDIRDKLQDWYESTAYTRLAPGGGVCLIETWWNDDDLAGRLQQRALHDELADHFEIVKYPAMAEAYEYQDISTKKIWSSTEPLPPSTQYEKIREPGDALHPERYDEVALKRIKSNMATRIWSALYQQNPVPDEGMYFKSEYFRTIPALTIQPGWRVFTAWDFAIGEKQSNDFTVGATMAQDEHDTLYVVNIIRMKVDAHAIVEAMVDECERCMQTYTGSSYALGVEDGMIWKSIKPLMLKRMQERKIFPPFQEMKPLSDKMARAAPLQGRMQHGKVLFPEHAPWFSTARHEMLRFPAGAHDDIVDALAWSARMAVESAPPQPIIRYKRPESFRDKLKAYVQGRGGTGSDMTA